LARPIVFLSDYGLQDEFVGTCHGVLARLAPRSRVIDLAHGLAPGDVLRGALILRQSLRYMPKDAVYLAVVDPGVGSDRKAVAVETVSGVALVGPDNGLLSLALTELEGVHRAVAITAPEVVLKPVSATFQGRDVFAPAAAHLAEGGDLEGLGEPVEPSDLVSVEVPRPDVANDTIRCQVLSVDRFGNAALNARLDDFMAAELPEASRLLLRLGSRRRIVPFVSAFSDVEEGGVAILLDSAGWLAIVTNGGDAAGALGLAVGDPVRITSTK